jgi:FlaG/FlaF family flagellin (archaellin)
MGKVMPKSTAQSSKVQVGNWNVQLVSDADGHLSVYIDNADGSQVNMIEEDIADNGTQWADRFTTKKLEQDCRDSE